MDFCLISVVVSGPVIIIEKDGELFNTTQHCCESIREKMPGAEIVFSTWENEKISGIDCDILVRSEDPGGANQKDGGNINRQICSRRAGIKAATRQYVLAIRSESHILNTDFLEYWGKYEKYSNDIEWKFLNKRVIIPATMPASRAKLFHMGDWYYFGEKDDVLKLWDLPYWEKGTRNITQSDLMYNAHRYVITAFIRKYHELQFDKRSDINGMNRVIYEKVVANNFVVTGFLEYGIDSYKYYYPKTRHWKLDQVEINYYHSEWIQLYNRYCDGGENKHLSSVELCNSKILIPARNRFRRCKRFVKASLAAIKGKKYQEEFYEY